MVVSEGEHDLVLRSREGDSQAFAALVAAHQHMIHSVTFRMTGSLADAEDLAQETFIQAYQQLTQFRGDAPFGAWLRRIAINRCLNWRQRDVRRARLHQEWSLEQAAASDSTGHAVARHVQDALARLNPKQRAAVVLTVYEGLSHAEAAKALGCSETTVSWRVFAARAKLKRFLKHAKEKGALA